MVVAMIVTSSIVIAKALVWRVTANIGVNFVVKIPKFYEKIDTFVICYQIFIRQSCLRRAVMRRGEVVLPALYLRRR